MVKTGVAPDAPRPPFRVTVRWYAELWRPIRWILLRLVVLTTLSAALRVALPSLFQPVLDQALKEGKVAPALALLILGVGIMRSVVYGFLQYTRASTNFRLGRVARERTFDLLTELGPDVYSKHPMGDLMARLSDDCSEEKMAWFACSGVFRLLEATIVIVFALTVMTTISPALTLIACAPLPVIAIVYRLVAGKLDRLYAGVQTRVSGLESFLDALFTGIRAVKANGLERAQTDRFEGLAFAHRDAEVRAANGQAGVHMLYGYGWQCCLPLLVFFGGRLITRDQLTPGAFTSFYGLTLMLVFPALDWGEFFVRLRQAGASVARLEELEANEPEVKAAASGAAPVLTKALAFEDAGRKSPDGRRTLLEAIAFGVPAGSTVAVVGAVGSGKSTVLKLVPRIMDPRPGALTLDGKDLREIDLGAWRRKVGYVPQEASLLSASVEENIRLGRDDLTDEQVRAACEAARLSQDVAALPEGLKTRVGERGSTLSGGQRQRVAIARALVHEPTLLVLDDVGAALDAHTEAALWDSLATLRPGLTKVVATHRPATIERADRVVVLDRGRVADQGTHRELLERCLVYREIYDRGRLEATLEARCAT
jgi:ATP-binding cassette subfamily B protein